MTVPTLFASGTQAATVTTEHFLSSPAVAGVFSFHIDLVNMVALDYVELRIYQMILTGGTSRVVYFDNFSGLQPADGMIQIGLPIGNDLEEANALRFSLLQLRGTSRNFVWKVLSY